MASSVISTRLILASLLAAVLIPRPPYSLQMLLNIRPNDVQLPRRESVIAGKRDRLEPGLAHHALAAHVHVLRLMTVEAVEEEPGSPPRADDSKVVASFGMRNEEDALLERDAALPHASRGLGSVPFVCHASEANTASMIARLANFGDISSDVLKRPGHRMLECGYRLTGL
jgi:hypothetical protein